MSFSSFSFRELRRERRGDADLPFEEEVEEADASLVPWPDSFSTIAI